MIQTRFDGDSISTRWADEAAPAYGELLRVQLPPADWSDFTIVAVPGQRSDEMLARARAADSTLPLPDPASARAVVVMLVGSNDLGQLVYARNAGIETPLSEAGLRSAVRDYCACARSRGWTVLPCTIIAGHNPGRSRTDIDGVDAARQAYNTWLEAYWDTDLGAAGLVRFDTDHRFATIAASCDERYYIDGVHLREPGRAVLAAMVGSALLDIASGLKPVVMGRRAGAGEA
ncbi:MAG: SGNH/GDSL hydrolase family protein [Planctomycetes bacterium]|nr:SGNH/GDSL hydrolase family protein [Planctomycetota bacterium]